MHAATTESGDLTRRIEACERRSVGSENASGQVGLKAAHRLARQDSEANRDQGTRSRIQESMRRHDPDQAVAKVAARDTNCEGLLILRHPIADLAVTGGDFALQLVTIEPGRIRQ